MSLLPPQPTDFRIVQTLAKPRNLTLVWAYLRDLGLTLTYQLLAIWPQCI